MIDKVHVTFNLHCDPTNIWLFQVNDITGNIYKHLYILSQDVRHAWCSINITMRQYKQ